MQIIPVLDIKDGVVVRGQGGDRANYRPIVTPLAAGSEPVAVAKGLMSLADFPAFYIADLDAIEGRAPNAAALADLLEAFPQPQFWIDAGVRTRSDVNRILAVPRQVAVIGSESIADASVATGLAGEGRAVLSLDFRGETFLGPAELLDDAALWPQRVVVMTLAKVGSGAGPDLARLAEITGRAAGRAVYAAGGVRHGGDVEALRDAGIAGALVSTALHDGRLSPATLRGLA
ncbi:HisA/HisF-related TIM barrel protein [Aurantimonas endophytica]|uniref:Phosphoribosylformimino-5-aminoimidazole carboxamide ribotide isomerase n=1 Tax=Aurantimonas endophytica TaxID=1522175 RepID=A0A7W6HDQ5_9HYPH|nr:HisA/HisF-related TIM barrel protein [Aurantimonas endophytica]MBB4003344.1 phosphoribosylformimino-5-aminoimidazole carboxamide ribotide isomerase [Aurantimonas endophytica]MCO6404205.1 nickel transporter [Aurantimonas endophytica]